MNFSGPSILLAGRAHGESAVIARLLTEEQGLIAAFVAGGRGRRMRPLMIPEDCTDGFLAAFWKRPEAYLDPKVRASISTFAKSNDLARGLESLASDLASGRWADINSEVLGLSELDAGYRLVTANIRPG